MNQPERGCLYTLLRIIAAAVILLFVPLSLAILVVYNLERQVFNPATYKSALDQQDFYNRAPALIAEAKRRSTASNGGGFDAFKYLSQSDIQSILSDVLPAAWLKAQTENAIDQAFAALDSNSPPRIIVSMAEVKTRLAGPQGVAALNRLIASWPACTYDQLVVAQQVIAAGGDLSKLSACNPPDSIRPLLAPLVEQAAVSLANSIPAEVDLAGSITGSAEDPRPTIRLAREIIHVSPFAPLLLLLVIAALAVRQPRDLNTWWGIPLLVTGILGIVVALASSPLRDWLQQELVSQIPPEASSLIEIGNGVIAAITQRAGLLIGAESALVALVGFVILVFGFSIWREDRAR